MLWAGAPKVTEYTGKNAFSRHSHPGVSQEPELVLNSDPYNLAIVQVT